MVIWKSLPSEAGFACHQTHRPLPVLESSLSAMTLTYEPAIQTAQGPQIAENHVLLEIFGHGSKTPRYQRVLRYLNPLTGIPEIFGKSKFHDEGLKLFYERFSRIFGDELTAEVANAEMRLPLERLATVAVKNARLNRYRGFMRIFDASIYKTGNRARTKYWAPAELEMMAKGKKTRVFETLRKAGFAIFEIGKYVLDEPTEKQIEANPELAMSSLEQLMVQKDEYLWLIDFLKTRGAAELPKSYYVAQVSSKIHRLSYQRKFKMETADRSESDGLAPEEDLLKIRGDLLLARLQTLIPEIDRQITAASGLSTPARDSTDVP